MASAKDFFNAVHPPLFHGPDDTLILDLIPIPELHVMLGIVNKIFDGLNLAWGDNQAYDWAYKNNIKRVAYRGGSMNGPGCEDLLQKLDKLFQDIPSNLRQYYHALQAFDRVRVSCFGNSLNPNFVRDIQNFRRQYDALKIPLIVKGHMIDHVEQFCPRKGRCLGFYSEQASESVHHDFQKTWQNYMVNVQNPNFGQQLLKATLKYNSKHV